MIAWLLLAGALSAAAFLVEEAAVWYARGAVRSGEAEDEERVFARRAARARLASALLVALGALVLVFAHGAGAPGWALALGAAAWTVAATGLVATEWGSPLQIAGRAVFSPLRPLARAVDAVLPGGAEEADEETRWLADREEDEAAGEALATVRDFRESLVEDVLVPRAEVVGLPADATVADALDRVGEEGFSRYPVYRDSLDTVVGILHVFDLLGADPSSPVAPLARDPFLASETKPVDALLRELQVSYNQMAVVVDEFGGTAGIVTVEDLLEDLVGEIRDETDEEELDLVRLARGVYRLDAGARVDDVNDALDLHLPEGEYDTVAGMVLDRLERIPRIGERLRVDEGVLEVTAAEPHRINTLRLTLADRTRRDGRGGRNGD